MFEGASARLEEALTELEIPVEEAALVWCFRFLDRFSARVSAAVAAFDEAEAWRERGATSMTAWLRQQAGLSGKEANRWQRAARRLASLPVTAKAYGDGVLSGGQVQAIVANLSDETAALFGQVEGKVVPQLAGLGVKDAATVMQAWAAAARDHLQPDPAEDEPAASAGPERSLHLSETLDGRAEVSGSLDPEGRALAETALRLADAPDVEGEPPRSPARRRADALLDIFQFFLDNQTEQRGGRHRPHLNVIVDHEDLVGERPRPGHHNGSPEPRSDAQHSGEDADADAEHAGLHGDAGLHGEGEPDASAESDAAASPQTSAASNRAAGPRVDVGSDAGAGLQVRAGSDGAAGRTGPGDHAEGGSGDLVVPLRSGPGRGGGGRLLDGTVLDAATLHRLACDAGVHRVIMQGRSSVLDYGWTTRTIPANLWAALVVRDHHCRFPGCDRPPTWCEGHHVVPWEHGGPTRLSNLVMHCRRHHHLLHMPGWDAKLLPDGTLVITDPRGNVFTSHPPGRLPDLFAAA